MKTISLKLIMLLSGFLFLTSCVLDQDRVDFGEGPVIAQFQKATASQLFIQKGTGELTDVKVKIESYGGDNMPTTNPVTVTVGVAAESQAKEGVEVTIPNKTITIPAGQNAAELLVKVNADKLTVGTTKKLVLEIVSSSETVSNGKQKMTVNLQAICASNLAGNYVYTNGTKKDVVIKSTGTGTYEADRDNAYQSAYAFTFSDNCGVLTVTGGYLNDLGYTASGTGTVDKATGDITITYTAAGLFANRTMILKKK